MVPCTFSIELATHAQYVYSGEIERRFRASTLKRKLLLRTSCWLYIHVYTLYSRAILENLYREYVADFAVRGL